MVAQLNRMSLKRGFSLIELVVVAGLVSLLSVGLVNLFLSTVKGAQRARLEAEMKSQGDFVTASMERIIRNAQVMPVCSEDGTRLTAEVRKADGVGNDVYEYSFSNEMLWLRINPLPDTSLNPLFSAPIQVEAVEFVCGEVGLSEMGKVNIEFRLGVLDDVISSQLFQISVALRNTPF